MECFIKGEIKVFKILVSLCILIVLSGCQYLKKVDESTEKPVPQVEVEVGAETEEIETPPTESGVVNREEITDQLTNQELLQLNKYFSHLQNGYFLSYDSESPDYEALLELGFWLFVFDYNAQVNNLEMDGTSYNVYEYNDFNAKINEYFDVQLPKEAVGNWLFIDNCYYYPHLGMGYSLNTVIQTERIFNNGDESFIFEGSIHQFESEMGDDHYDQYLQPKSTWSSSMESQLIGTVTATIVYSERLNQYVIENYETTLVYTNNDGMDYPETNDLMSEETQIITEQEFTEEYIIDEEYAINQINQLPNIQAIIDLGAEVRFMVEEDKVIDGMVGWGIQAYQDDPDLIATIGWYFVEYNTGDVYQMNIVEGEYERIN